jgi:hypothetical protein
MPFASIVDPGYKIVLFLREIAERDLKAGETLSPEFEAPSQRIGQVGGIAGSSSS